MSDGMRRGVRHASHGAKNEHRFGAAGSQTCSATASRRSCDVHERACRAARRTPSARRVAALVWKSLLVFSGSDAMSDCMRRVERHAGHGAKNEHRFGAAGSQTCNARASRRPCDVHERACRAARRTPSARRFAAFVWKAVLALSGSDAMSDSIRRLERTASHGAKNSHSIGSAESDVQRQPAAPRP